jgi:hypothetical protein
VQALLGERVPGPWTDEGELQGLDETRTDFERGGRRWGV